MARLASLGVQEQGWRKGPWTAEEDKLLTEYVGLHGEGKWSSVAKSSGLNRCGKSCRLRWVNYLRPGLKKGHLSPQEEGIIIELHALWGNKWSTIARCLPGRTDNEIKNYWRTHFKGKAKYSQSEKKPRIRALREQQPPQQQQQQKQQQEDDKHDMVFMCPNVEDQCPSMMFQDDAFLFDSKEDEGLWSGLWNFDDFRPQFDNRVTKQNLGASLCGEEFKQPNVRESTFS